jgi:hypothetical protein
MKADQEKYTRELDGLRALKAMENQEKDLKNIVSVAIQHLAWEGISWSTIKKSDHLQKDLTK